VFVTSYNNKSIFRDSDLKLVLFRNIANRGLKSRIALKMSEEKRTKKALPVNEYLFAIIIIQLFIKFPLLGGTKRGHIVCPFLFQVSVIPMNHKKS
jgi:hypothetical protein